MIRRMCLLSSVFLLLGCERPLPPPPPATPRPAPVTSDGPPPTDIAQESPADPRPAPVEEAPLSPAARRFLGSYGGDQLALELWPGADGQVQGTLVIGEREPAPLTASVKARRLRGSFRARQRAFTFEATLDDDALAFTADGKTYRLERAVQGPAAPTLLASFAAQPSDERDPVLHGTWLQGVRGAPPAWQLAFQLGADGSYLYGRPGSETGRITGEWRTRDGVLFTRPKGAAWTRYATYAVHGDVLDLTHAERSEAWYRP